MLQHCEVMSTDVKSTRDTRIHWPSLVRHYRVSKGFKQAALADELGVTQTMVSRWEAGLADPSARIQAKLFDRFWETNYAVSRDTWRIQLRRHPAAVAVFDPEGRFLAVSRGTERLIGRPESALIGESVMSVFSGDLAMVFDDLCRAGFFEGRVVFAESAAQLQLAEPGEDARPVHSHGLYRPVFMSDQDIYLLASLAVISRDACTALRARLGGMTMIRKAL